MATTSKAVRARFADFELDLSSGELRRNGSVVRLQGQPFLVLRVLLEHSGEVVTREELQHRLWPDETFVDFDHGVNKAIAKLRDALDDSKSDAALIQTLPRRGYRFTSEVDWIGPRNGQPASEVEVPVRRTARVSRWLVAGLVPALLLMAALWMGRRRINSWFGSQPVIQSVAVLPLINLSNDSGQQYLADGITDELITDLSYAKPLRVLSRSSTVPFRNSSLTASQIADRLHVDALMEGTVLRVDDAVRVTIRLTVARPERQIWAASYERKMSDAMLLQRQIAADAVGQIRAQLTPDERTRLMLENRTNPEAYDEYLRARFFLHQETAQSNKSIPHLERAIQLDPNFAPAYAALGVAWGMEGVWAPDVKVQDVYAKALEYSRRGVSLDPMSAEAYASLGHSLMQNRRWNEAETALRRAIQLDPNNLQAIEYLTLVLIEKDRLVEGLAISRKATTDNPVAIDMMRVYAMALFLAGQYDDALDECKQILELDPNHLAAYGTLADVLAAKGRFREAEDAYGKAGFMDPGRQAWLYAREGNSAEARRILKNNPSLVDVPAAVARYVSGDQERGLADLDYLANDAWDIRTYKLRVDPIFDPMRNDPRFNAIVKKTGLLDN